MAAHNAVAWFEVPVKDMERAKEFYESVLGIKLERHQMGDLDIAGVVARGHGRNRSHGITRV